MTRRRVTHGLLILATWLLSLSPLVAREQATTDAAIAVQDVLTVTVFDQAQLSGKYVVDPDGTIAFPLIGRVRVAGLTVRDVERELRRHLADGFFTNPQVSVSIEQFRSQQVFVMGEVRNPGAFPLTSGMTIIEAIARAGSTTPEANQEAVIVRPPAASTPAATAPATADGSAPQAGESTVLRVDLRRLASGVLTENVLLRSGDTVFVSRLASVFVLGQVKSPGSYLTPTGTTVLQAISMAGGATDRGTTGRLRIIRIVNGKQTEIKVKLSDLVQPGDTIFVLERIL